MLARTGILAGMAMVLVFGCPRPATAGEAAKTIVTVEEMH
jgi:hypothetical protein